MQAFRPTTSLKEALTQVFSCEYCETFKEYLSWRISTNGCFWLLPLKWKKAQETSKTNTRIVAFIQVLINSAIGQAPFLTSFPIHGRCYHFNRDLHVILFSELLTNLFKCISAWRYLEFPLYKNPNNSSWNRIALFQQLRNTRFECEHILQCYENRAIQILVHMFLISKQRLAHSLNKISESRLKSTFYYYLLYFS